MDTDVARCSRSFERLQNSMNGDAVDCVRCASCQGWYAAKNWTGRCVVPGCPGEACIRAELPPPHDPPVRLRRPLPTTAGLINGLTDRPLGLSEGVISFLRDNSCVVEVRNNSSNAMEMNELPGPVWISVVSSNDSWPKAGRQLLLQPDETRSYRIILHEFHPPNGEAFVDLFESCGVQIVLEQNPLRVFCWQVLTSVLALLYVDFLVDAFLNDGSFFKASLMGGGYCGTVVALCPGLILKPLMQLTGNAVMPAGILFAEFQDRTSRSSRLLLAFILTFLCSATGMAIFFQLVRILGSPWSTFVYVSWCGVVLWSLKYWHDHCGVGWKVVGEWCREVISLPRRSKSGNNATALAGSVSGGSAE